MLAISAEQMQRVDEIAVRKYGILLVQMMELAGFRLASARVFGGYWNTFKD
jgi:NAD(P)H-hydrate repair Nnr-like enzyme with NAD(P)H-hydrate epimerase domain